MLTKCGKPSICTTMKDYHDVYLESDVLLLADVFENFRTFSMNNYKLDPAHYYSSPGLSWDAALKMTGVKLSLLTDIDMLLMFESSIRGGISTVSNRSANANNKYMGDSYDPTKPTSYIHFVDANSLYGYSMGRNKMPVGGFKWVPEGQVENFDVMSKDPEGDTGYILEVDLLYPDHLHDLHSDYPLAAEKMTPTDDILSDYQKEMKVKLGLKNTTQKLIPNLYPKTKYTVHFKNLQYYVNKGMVITKIHRVLKFHQTYWLRQYIDFNTEKRKLAKSSEEKNNYKYMVNSIYGRSLMDVRSHLDVRVIHNDKQAKRLIAKPNYAGFHKINDELVAVKMKKVQVYWNKPTFLGFCILELSKHWMYSFHYDVILRKYGKNAKLLMTDTDSLMYHIYTDDIYEDMLENLDDYDTSDYPPTHVCYSQKNCKVLGKFKDETNGTPAISFTGLRSKMYAILLNEKGDQKNTAKGIKRSHVKKNFTYESYRECLEKETAKNTSFYNITSKNHNLSTTLIKKRGLCAYDDKRYLIRNSTDTLAFGHKDIR